MFFVIKLVLDAYWHFSQKQSDKRMGWSQL